MDTLEKKTVLKQAKNIKYMTCSPQISEKKKMKLAHLVKAVSIRYSVQGAHF